MKRCTALLIAFLLYTVGMAQWSADPNQNLLITKLNQKVYSTFFKTHTNGNTYTLYLSPNGSNSDGGTICSYLQILNKKGEKQLGEGGLLISAHKSRTWTIVNDLFLVDKDGNAIIVTQDCRNAIDSSQALNYSAYKISPTGEFLWGKDGIDLGRGKAFSLEGVMTFIQVGDQYLFAWYRAGLEPSAASISLYKSGIYNSPISSSVSSAAAEPSYIVMERLDKDGKFVGETQYIKDNSTPYSYPFLRNAGNGQAILVYAKGTNQDLTARKLDFDGSSVWASDITVYRGGFGSIPIWTFVKVYEDPKGGVFVSWHDDRNNTNIESAYLSYIKPDGSYGYAAGIEGQQIGFSGLRQFAPYMVYNPSDESVYACWRETSSGQSWTRICAQRIDKVGDLMWDVEGVDIHGLSDTTNVGYYSCQLDKENRMMNFFMMRDNAGGRNAQAYAYLLDASGKPVWAADKKFAPISTAKGDKANLVSLPFFENQYVVFWTDSRSVATSVDQSLYSQNMSLDGRLGNIVDNEILSEAKSGFYMHPNPVQTQANFMLEIKGNSKVNLSIYNSLGQKINTVFEGNLSSGGHEFSWDAAQHQKGIYFAVLNNNGKICSFKIIHQ